jgi:hypothetical protein
MIHVRQAVVAGVVVGIVSVSPSVMAESFRCGTSLITEGMAVSEIESKCGPPASIETKTEEVYGQRPDGTTFFAGTEVTEYWTYDFGPSRFPMLVTVKDARADKIETLPRD